MEKFQLDELKNYKLMALSDYKEYPVKIDNVLGFNDDNTIAILSDKTYMFRVKDSFLKLGFIKNNQVTIFTFSELYFVDDTKESLWDLLNRVMRLNKFKTKEGCTDGSGYNGSTFSKDINDKSILAKIESTKTKDSCLTNISICLLSENVTKVSLGLFDVQDIEEVYDYFQNMFGVNLNAGMFKESYTIKDSIVEQHLERINELQEELTDEEFLAVLEKHPEYIEIYNKGHYSREDTRKILEGFVDAVEKKRDREYRTQYALMEGEILKMEDALRDSKAQLRDFAKRHKIVLKKIEDLDL